MNGEKMNETENTDVQTEVVAPAVEEPHNAEDQSQERVPEQTEMSDKEINFAAMRQANDELKKELAETKRFVQEIMAQREQPANVQQLQEEVDELEQIANDEWLTKEQSMKLADKRAQLAVEKALEAERSRQAQEALPGRIKQEMPDFDQVVSKENVEYLKAQKPHLAQVLAATTDHYAQAKAAYDAIQAFCPSAQVSRDKKAVERNAHRPGSLDQTGPARVSDGDPLRLTPSTRQQLWKEMQEYARG